MNRFFVEKENITDSSAVLYGEDVKHISSVLRLRTGDEVCCATALVWITTPE